MLKDEDIKRSVVMIETNLFDLKMIWEYDCYQSGKDSFVRGLLYLESKEDLLSRTSKNQSHLVMVLDISGSMNTQNKYPLLKQALEIMLANLEDGFYISIILFSSHAQLICKALPGNEAKNKIADIIEAIDNSPVRFQATNLSYGLDMAFDIVREYRKHREEVIPRIYILTDGDLTDTQQCYARTKELESLNVEVNSYGFGNDFAFETMKQLMGATYGGMIKHISNNNDIIETFQRIIQVTALIVASEVNFKVTFEDGVIPGDFFCYRPAIRFWQASDFMPPKAPQFDVGNIEAQRKYIWAIEARISEEANPGYKLADLQINYKRIGKSESIVWPIFVPVIVGSPTILKKNIEVERVFTELEALRSNDVGVQIAAYEARIKIAREEKRDPAYIKALEEVLQKLRSGEKREDIDNNVLKRADAVAISYQVPMP
jgi:uncharacterized protein YegL